MRVAIALCSFVVMCLVGCGGTERVTFVDGKGKSVGAVDMDVRTVDQMRKGELDMTQHAVYGGFGYLVGCGVAPFPYPAETTMHRNQWWAGDCMVTGSWVNGYFFSLNESFAVWPSDGASMDNSVRSFSLKAPTGKQTQFHSMRNADSSGGGHDGITQVNGGVSYGTLLTDAQCPSGTCSKPLESTSFYGYVYLP